MGTASPLTVDARPWLLAVLRGDDVPIPSSTAEAAVLAEAALQEGVAALVARALSAQGAHGAVRDAFDALARQQAVFAMLRAAECRQVLELCGALDVRVLLLKGSALAYWLYPEPYLRQCGDVDLLVPDREAARRLKRELQGLGYTGGYDQGARAYERVCRKPLGGRMQLDLDVHWALNNAPVFAGAFDFDTLWASARPLPGLSPRALGLAPVHALVHACTHRAINLYTAMGDRLHWLYDIHLLFHRLSGLEREELVHVAAERGLASVCHAGLHAASEAFGPLGDEACLQALTLAHREGDVDGARLQDWRYMHRMNLRALPGWWQRAAWLWAKAFPDAAHLREMYGTQRSLAGLWWARTANLATRARTGRGVPTRRP